MNRLKLRTLGRRGKIPVEDVMSADTRFDGSQLRNKLSNPEKIETCSEKIIPLEPLLELDGFIEL